VDVVPVEKMQTDDPVPNDMERFRQLISSAIPEGSIIIVDDLVSDFDFKPTTTIEEGIEKFVAWYRVYFKV
jgi:nucleoside-diphosphate-sugar epimerase